MAVLDAKGSGIPLEGAGWKSPEMAARRRSRYAADRRLQFYGIAAIVFALGFLAILLATLLYSGSRAFTQTMATVEIDLSAADLDPAKLMEADWRKVTRTALRQIVPDLPKPAEKDFFSLFTNNAQYIIRDAVIADPARLAAKSTITIPLSDPIDQLAKGLFDRNLPPDQRRVNDRQIAFYDQLVEKGMISHPLNWGLIFNSDSRFPELAGLAGAIVGSFWTLLVCFVLSFPDRHRGRDLPRGVRAEEPLDRPDRGQHQQPRSRALDRVRPARPCRLHRLVRPAAIRAAGRRHGAVADDAADDHHRHARRAEAGAVLDPRGGARGRRLQARRRFSITCCRWRCPAS